MAIVRTVWRVLVGIKDALVLLFLLLFFGLIYAALNARPSGTVREGALLLRFNGVVVEQPAPAQLGLGGSGQREWRLRDVVYALDAARGDSRIKAVALDLDGFGGAGRVALGDLGAALDRFKASRKPVLAYASALTDGSYYLAAHASQIWLEPSGLAVLQGPGRSQPYFKGLIDKLGVTTHVYRVGKYKSFVEPFTRDSASPEAKENLQSLVGALFADWQADVSKARPKAQLAAYLRDPGDAAPERALAAGLVDRLGTREEWGRAVAKVAGAGRQGQAFAQTPLAAYVADKPYDSGTGRVGIATVAGSIVDGEAPAGTAGGDTVARLINRAVAEGRVKALVLRVDSPGGSAEASERIRQALLAARVRGLPVVVSMGNVAASGGYWVTTAGERVFAEPATITGSIGVFGIIPTFENTIKKAGISADGVRSTPLSGQPDILGGTTSQFDAIVQRSIETIYARFVGIVAQARRMPAERVNEIAQGRVWDGGSARQLGLVDQFGNLDDAIAYAARRAGLDPAQRHAVWLEKPKSWTDRLAESFGDSNRDDEEQADALGGLVRARMAAAAAALEDVRLLTTGAAVQARCLECETVRAAPAPAASVWSAMLSWLGWKPALGG